MTLFSTRSFSIPTVRLRHGFAAGLLGASLAVAGALSLPVAAQPAPAATASTAAPPTTQAPPPPAIDAGAFVLTDFQTGDVIAASNADARLEPASITKVMTSYVVAAEIRAGKVKPTDMVLISEKAWREGGAGTDGSFSGLALNSRVKLDDVLHGLIIQSGNDAAIALAEHVAGSEDAFVALMNQYAEKLGMKNTHFMNAHGLSQPGHYMSAHDIAILGRALISQFPEHYAIYSQREFTYNGIRQYNRNGLLARDPSVDGIKTGHTDSAGFCLAASAKRDGRRLISVVMGIHGTKAEGFAKREEYNLALLNYGFRFTETQSLLGRTQPASSVPVWKGAADAVPVGTLEPVALTLPRGAGAQAQFSISPTGKAIAPIAVGQTLGTVNITLNGHVVKTEPLVALADVPEGSLWRRIVDTVRLWFA